MRKILERLLELVVILVLYLESKEGERLRKKAQDEKDKAQSNPSQAFIDKFNTSRMSESSSNSTETVETIDSKSPTLEE